MPSTRRSVLASTGLALAGVAGCLQRDTTRIGDLRLSNDTDTVRTVAVQVARDDDVVHDDTYRLGRGGDPDGPPSTRRIQSTWESSPAVYRVAVDVSGGPTASYEYGPGNEMGTGCWVVDVMLEFDRTGDEQVVFASNPAYGDRDCRGDDPE